MYHTTYGLAHFIKKIMYQNSTYLQEHLTLLELVKYRGNVPKDIEVSRVVLNNKDEVVNNDDYHIPFAFFTRFNLNPIKMVDFIRVELYKEWSKSVVKHARESRGMKINLKNILISLENEQGESVLMVDLQHLTTLEGIKMATPSNITDIKVENCGHYTELTLTSKFGTGLFYPRMYALTQPEHVNLFNAITENDQRKAIMGTASREPLDDYQQYKFDIPGYLFDEALETVGNRILTKSSLRGIKQKIGTPYPETPLHFPDYQLYFTEELIEEVQFYRNHYGLQG